MEKTGQLLQRAHAAFDAVTGANTNPYLQNVQRELAPKLAAHRDAIYLNPKLFTRVRTVYQTRDKLHLDPESQRLVEIVYDQFVHAGAALSDADKEKLKKLNEEASKLEEEFSRGLLEATKKAAYTTTDKSALAGLTDAEIAAAAQAASARKVDGYVIPLQNTTQQPDLTGLTNRSTREALFEKGWTRSEQPGNDLRPVIARLAQLRAEKAKLLGFDSYAAWKLEDQMAKTSDTVLHFLNELIPAATAKAGDEGKDIQAVIDAQQGGFQLQPWDWNFYAEQVRKAKYDLDESQVKPYFEINNVLENGVFYAAHELYGLSFTERKNIPVWQPDVRVFEVHDADGKPLALFYCDYFKRDNKNGGAWMSSFVDQSELLGDLPVVYNVANLPKPAPGEPALISADDVRTMFHEFGHALHGMLSNVEYPTLSGTSVPRDFVEFPSQFNEHWATYPTVFQHYAKHYKTGEPMPLGLAEKVIKDRAAVCVHARYAMAHAAGGHAAAGRRRLRKGRAREVARGSGHGSTALSLHLLYAHLGKRLRGWLLRLSVGRDAGRRRISVVRGERRADARQRRSLPEDGVIARQHGESGQDVRILARAGSGDWSDAEGPRPRWKIAGRQTGVQKEKGCPVAAPFQIETMLRRARRTRWRWLRRPLRRTPCRAW
jgi:peptidyl-dipeptidase Dcp